MPTTYGAGTPTVPGTGSTVTALVDGDAVNANNLFKETSPGTAPNLTLKFLWDWLYFVVSTLWPGSLLSTSSATTFTRWAGAMASGIWQGFGTSTWEQTAVTPTTSCLFYYLDVPQGATLNSISVTILGSPSDTGLPANMPTLYLVYMEGTTVSLLGSTADASANVTAYKAAHTITVAPGGGVVVNNATGKLAAVLTPESGSGSNAGLIANSLSYTWTGAQLGR